MLRFGCWGFLLFMGISACGSSDNLLLGQWQGVSAMQAGDSLQLDPTEISFRFDELGVYHYSSTLNHQEAGYYRQEGDRLFATDSTRQNSSERIVAIEQLTPDSLTLRWRNGEAEQTVVLLKQ